METMRALALVLLVLDLWALYDIMRRPVDVGDKVLWVLLVWLFPLLGLLLYLIFGRPYLARSERRRLSQH